MKAAALHFAQEASEDPKKAFTEDPVMGGIAAVVFATVIGMLGVCTFFPSFLLPRVELMKLRMRQ